MTSPRYLLDTDLCIYIQRERPASVRNRFAKLKPGEAAISTITLGELRYGAERSARRDDALAAIDEFCALVPPLPLTPEVGIAYGRIRAPLARAGKPIGNNDLWIAAHAVALDLILVSNNTREFARVDGLALENWA